MEPIEKEVRKLCKKILPGDVVDGNSCGVPTIVDVVEMLIEKFPDFSKIVTEEKCDRCEKGYLSYNQNLNPNTFKEGGRIKCFQCKGTRTITRPATWEDLDIGKIVLRITYVLRMLETTQAENNLNYENAITLLKEALVTERGGILRVRE